MTHRIWGAVCLLVLSAAPLLAQSTPPVRSARTVTYHARDLVSVRGRLHYTTMIVLPDGEEVVEATCGDKEAWLVNVRAGLVSLKPTTAGSETNLNLLTTSGQVYAFLLAEVSAAKGQDADLTVYLERDPTDAASVTTAAPTYVPAAQLDDLRAQVDLARDLATRATERARVEVDTAVTTYRQQYPTTMRFPYRIVQDKAPFRVRAMWHDDHRTFIQMVAGELPTLYEYQDRLPALVNFTVQDGTYIVPKVLQDGYLQIGAARLGFRAVEAK